jgi:SAM-dependent methyltransferase
MTDKPSGSPGGGGARSFGPAADRYDRVRPSYPPAALAWALGGDRPRRVVDLGAGTGILTRVLRSLGHEVIPVEPDPRMREGLAGARGGDAEHIPLPDASVDAVLAGQAYHWFDQDRAHPEIARVLRDGGVFAPVWNIRDESVPWVARLTEIVDDQRGADHAGILTNPDFGPWFGPVERRDFRQDVPMTADRLVELIGTRSYYLTATPERQRELDRRVRALAEEQPAGFALPYRTVAYRATRSARTPSAGRSG